MPEELFKSEPPLPEEKKEPGPLKKAINETIKFEKKSAPWEDPKQRRTIPWEDPKQRRTITIDKTKIYKGIITGAGIVIGTGAVIYGLKAIKGNAPAPEVGVAPRSTEEVLKDRENIVQVNYSLYGMSGPLNIESLKDPQHGNNPNVIAMAAKDGGPNWLFDTLVPDKNSKFKDVPGFSEAALHDISSQLNLSSADQDFLRHNWEALRNDPNMALNWLASHGANPQVIEFYKYAIEVKARDHDPSTVDDRVKELKVWEPKPDQPPTPISHSDGGRAGLAAPKEQQKEATMAVVGRIFVEGMGAEGATIDSLVKPAIEIAQSLIVNHRLPSGDDLQGWFNTAVEAGDRLIDHFKDLPAEIRDLFASRAEHGLPTTAHDADHIYSSPDEAINHLIGGGGLPMAIILGIEMGLSAINAAIYLKRSVETGRVELPSADQIRRRAVMDELAWEKELNRGTPDGYISVGNLMKRNFTGVISSKIKDREVSRETVGEIIIEVDSVDKNSDEYQKLTKLLQHGVKSSAWELLKTRGLLVQDEKMFLPQIKAVDLEQIIFELESKGQYTGETLPGEPIVYD